MAVLIYLLSSMLVVVVVFVALRWTESAVCEVLSTCLDLLLISIRSFVVNNDLLGIKL